MSTINFATELFKIRSWTLLRLPKSASAQLPTRGMTMVTGTINGFRFTTALEPDGKGSHWFKVSKPLCKAAGVNVGDTVTIIIEPATAWPEPKVPADLKAALSAVSPASSVWIDITPAARWDWIRWIDATRTPETRKRRIATACSMLLAGKRRPCCFNRNQCTEPSVSNNGVLLDQAGTVGKKRKNS